MTRTIVGRKVCWTGVVGGLGQVKTYDDDDHHDDGSCYIQSQWGKFSEIWIWLDDLTEPKD